MSNFFSYNAVVKPKGDCMYHDFSNTRRNEWRYHYKGSDLLSAAKDLLEEYEEKETEARNLAAKLLTNMNIGAESKAMQDAKREIEQVARIHEELKVYVHEFSRKPEETYTLSLGDVVFFGFPKP